MATKKPSKERNLSRYLKAPIRMLSKARDFYIKSMSECNDRLGYGAAMGCPAGQINSTPRSYSVGSTISSNGNDDYRELLRAASTRSLDNKIDLDPLKRQQSQKYQITGANKMPRSHSVVIGRIDEEKSCDFEDDIKAKPVFQRSRTYAVSKKTTWGVLSKER